MIYWSEDQILELKKLLQERKNKFTFIRLHSDSESSFAEIMYPGSKRSHIDTDGNIDMKTFIRTSRVDYPKETKLGRIYSDIREIVLLFKDEFGDDFCVRSSGNTNTINKTVVLFFPTKITEISVHSCKMLYGQNTFQFRVIITGVKGESIFNFNSEMIPLLLKNEKFSEELLPELARKTAHAKKMVEYYGKRLDDIYNCLSDDEKLLVECAPEFGENVEDDSQWE